MHIIFGLFLILSIPFIPDYAHTDGNGLRVYTNEDLKKERPAQKQGRIDDQPDLKASRAIKKRDPQKSSADSGKDKWCKNGTHLRNRVDGAKDSLKTAEKKQADAAARAEQRKKGRQKATAVSDAPVRKAKGNLARAEKQLSDLEQDAHRKGIPPGWLRCQFSY